MNISVPDRLADEVRLRDLPISAICQRALREEVSKVRAVDETVDIKVIPAGAGSNPDPHTWPDFTLDMPHLIYGRHSQYGDGWTLWYNVASGPGDNPDDYFIPGGPDDVLRALDSARRRLRLARDDAQAITVEIGEPAITVGFKGRWLIEPDANRTRTGQERHDAGAYWGVALTRRGRIAVVTAHRNELWPAALRDYDSLNDAVEAGLPADIAAEAAARLGGDFILWRDI
jgi:hypothetical protein